MVFLGVAFANAPLFPPLVLALFWGKANPRSGAPAMIATAVVGMLSAGLWYGKIDGLLGDIHYYIMGPAAGFAIMLAWTFVRPVRDR
jgi:Na+/proline symporter